MFGTEVTGMSIPTAIVLNIIPESAKNQKAAMDATETVWKKLFADVTGNMVKVTFSIDDTIPCMDSLIVQSPFIPSKPNSKIFIGGLPKETEYNEFNNHFGKYGDITDSVIMKDRLTGQPRGFGFITYADPLVVDKVIQDTHVFSGKQVEIKRTIPRETANSKGFKTKKSI
nr:heterogeneous nuclear ribonucleoprotein 1 [Tanacetum cinerariifolium]